MLKSLYAGVSGLRNHQMKMDVLGNNIANINTVGYKGGRINFSEALCQTISNATPSRGTGFINPMQVGLGMKTSSIENIFTQGGLESTGITTDLALEGDGFFVVKSDDNQMYTRAGQFFFNLEGRLVNQRGLAVQGWMLSDAVVEAGLGSANLSDIVIDSNMISEAEETDNVYLTGNLNAGLETTTEVWTTGSALTEAGVDATAASLLNNLDQTTTPLIAGDTIEIVGTNPDGSAVSSTYTYVAGDTVQQLLNAIDAAYTGATSSIVDGNIVLTDAAAGDSSTTISLSNGAANTGAVNIASFANTTPGETATANTSVVVYDSLGAAHNLFVEFTKTTTDGEWTWQATTSGDETITGGGSGRAVFDSAGALVSFTYDGNVNELTMDPNNGANIFSFSLHTETTDEYTGLSQFDSLSTLNVREQDGRATGSLLGVTINRDGTISASFSNGEIESIAKIAMAKFATNGGLSDLGDGMYQESIASGEEQIISLEDNLTTSIVSGALEMSNVDLAKEFTEMIITQRGFQANAKVITTSDQLLEELVRIKR